MKSKLQKVIIFIVILIIIFLFYLISIFFPLKKRYANVISGLNNSGKNIAKLFTLLYIRKNLLIENQKLKEKITRLQEKNALLLKTQQENNLLKEQLNFFHNRKLNFVLANIIGKKKEGDIEYFILDRGSSDGIKVDSPVVDKNYLVGKIIKVEKYISYFLPLTDRRFLISVDFISDKIISNKEIISGLARGSFDSFISVEFIPSDKKIEKEDIVITSGLEEKIPRGLIIGYVKNIIRKKNTIFSKAIIQPFIDPDNLRIVSILTSK